MEGGRGWDGGGGGGSILNPGLKPWGGEGGHAEAGMVPVLGIFLEDLLFAKATTYSIHCSSFLGFILTIKLVKAKQELDYR